MLTINLHFILTLEDYIFYLYTSTCFHSIVFIIIIIIIIILVITCVQGIYIYVPETKYFSRVCSVATVLYLQFVLHVMLLSP